MRGLRAISTEYSFSVESEIRNVVISIIRLPPKRSEPAIVGSTNGSRMALPSPVTLISGCISGFTRTARVAVALYPAARTHAGVLVSMAFALAVRGPRGDIYNILWAVVFGFATLNILSLAARRFDPNKRGMSFGEMMAVMVVLTSVFLLAWEMLNLFHIFPIQIRR